jgi:hypothetical protein
MPSRRRAAASSLACRALRAMQLTPDAFFCPCSGSMEPAFYRGDILFLTNPATERFAVGDITVYKIPGADIPIVHRVIEAHDLPSVLDPSSSRRRDSSDRLTPLALSVLPARLPVLSPTNSSSPRATTMLGMMSTSTAARSGSGVPTSSAKSDGTSFLRASALARSWMGARLPLERVTEVPSASSSFLPYVGYATIGRSASLCPPTVALGNRH